MKLLLARHGETGHNLASLHNGQGEGFLTPRGIEQAKRLAQRLQGENISKVYCSDLHRTRETLNILGINAPVEFTHHIRERALGVFENKPYGSFRKYVEENDLDLLHFKPEGGESIAEARRRVLSFFGECVSKHNGETVLWMSHSGIIKIVLLHALKERTQAVRVQPRNCSLSVVDLDGLKPNVVLVNDTSHIEDIGYIKGP